MPRATVPLAERFWDKVDRSAGLDSCWLWTGPRNRADGYGSLSRGSRDAGHVYAHRLSWEIHHGPTPAGLLVLHHCDNPPCVNYTHLFLGTQADNLRDMDAKDRRVPPAGDRNGSRTHPECYPKGSARRHSKLREPDIPVIRGRSAGGDRLIDIAADYGVSDTTILHVVQRKKWKHVD